MSFSSNAGPVKGSGLSEPLPGTLQDLVAEARYLMRKADDSLKRALAAAVAVGHEVARGALAPADFEDGAAEARVYAAVAKRYFDHADFTPSDWEVVGDLHLQAVTDWMRLFANDVRPGTAAWRLRNRLRANPLAGLAALHLRDERRAAA